MSFDPTLGFSSYATTPAYSIQSMVQPTISPFGSYDPGISSFGLFDPAMSSFGMIDPAMSSFAAIQPEHYMPYPPPHRRPYPYPPMSPQYGDPSGGLMGMMGQLIQLFASLFNGQSDPVREPDPQPVPDDGRSVPEDETEEEVDRREDKIKRLDPSDKTTDALKILSIYSKDLGAKNGMLTKENLEDFIEYGAKEKGVPDKVKKAAEVIKDNEALYNLLCLQSESDPQSGFALSSLTTQWEEDLEIDNLQASPSKTSKAVDTILEHKVLIGKLSGDASDISRKDLEDLALGETEIPELSKSESRKLQAAALKLLSDRDTFDKIDKLVHTAASNGADGTAGTADDVAEKVEYTGTKNKAFTLTELAEWYERNDD
jgi:hypothetical protein